MRLSDRLLQGLKAPAKGNKLYFDEAVGGFAVRVTAASAKSFVLDYRRRDGLQRRMTLGSFPDWSTAAAREEAKRLKREIDSGGDPIGERTAEREAPSVADICARFLDDHASMKRATTAKEYRSLIAREIVPVLGKIKVAAVEFEHVERFHRQISKRAPVRANRALAALGTVFALAIKLKMRSDNPARGVRRNREHPRRRYLSANEVTRLTMALAGEHNQDAADVFRFLLLTGARRAEATGAKWDEFDLTTGVWSKLPSTTKQAEHHHVPLNAPARALLAARWNRRDPSVPWVFPGRKGRHPIELRPAWTRVLRAAGIAGLRIHDLRHSYASQLVNAGFNLPTIGRLLGHKQPMTTARYSHLYDDTLREATERVGAVIAGKPLAEVLSLDKRGRR